MSQHDDKAIAAFIRARGVTRCPTACAAPTQAVVTVEDRLALRQLANRREVSWQAKREARARHLLGRAEARLNTEEGLCKVSHLRRHPHAPETDRFPGFDA